MTLSLGQNMSEPILIQDYHYDLPGDRIAYFPLPDRDKSKLLVYSKGEITNAQFDSITKFIPENCFLFFNNTRVIPARLRFTKNTGATIEIFLLSPVKPSSILAETMEAKGYCSWSCTIGNVKRWKENSQLIRSEKGISLSADLHNRADGIVEFSWTPNHLSFAEVISKAGVSPLPPYIKREANEDDLVRYQTIFAKHEGAVAAPTAGLHFTDTVLDTLKEKGIRHDYLTLHVSAGTFQPVKNENALEHQMHSEQIFITKENIENILLEDTFILPVGTTSMRTLESIYWYGVKLLKDPEAEFQIGQNDPYNKDLPMPTATEAIKAVQNAFLRKNLASMVGHTSIYIRPGYTFQICRGLITNFHLPGSTLILLVAALLGQDWKRVYETALKNNYRFLSYGDSSLLIP